MSFCVKENEWMCARRLPWIARGERRPREEEWQLATFFALTILSHQFNSLSFN